MIRDETAFQAQAALDQLAATAHATALSAAVGTAPTTPTSASTPTTSTATTATAVAPIDPAEVLKKDLINQRVRNDNRERKKRWREANEDRSKSPFFYCCPLTSAYSHLLCSSLTYTYIQQQQHHNNNHRNTLKLDCV